MMSRTAATVLALLAVVLAAVLLQPWWLAPLLARDLEAASGRSVRVDSMRVGLSWRFEPVVHLRGIRIANAPWADSTLPFAALEEAVIRFSLRSLDEGRPVVDLMILRDGQVDLERQADGLRNWRLRDPDNRGPGRYKVLALQPERLALRFRHAGVDVDLKAEATANGDAPVDETAANAKPVRIAFAGQWRKLPFTANVTTGAVLTFLETGETFPLQGRVDAGGSRLDIDGRAGDIFRKPSFDADIALAGDTLGPLRVFFGPRHDGLGKKPFRLRGHLNASDGSVTLSGAEAKVGSSDFAGTFEFVHRDDRSGSRLRLRSNTTDGADLRWLVGRSGRDAPVVTKAAVAAATASARAASASTPAQGASSAAPASRFAIARHRAFEVAIEIARLRDAELPWLRGLAVQAQLLDGRLDVKKLDASLSPGRASGHGSVDLSTDTASAEGELAIDGLRLESLLGEQAAKKRVTGLLHARAKLKARGNSADALLASATGRVDASLAGSISGLLDAEIGLQGGKILRGFLSGPEQIAIRCAAAGLDLQAGRGRIRTLVLDTERTRTTGSGTVDFGRETVDVVLTPEAKQGGLLVLERSIRVHGPLRKPAKELVARVEPGAARGQACAPS